MLERFDDAWYRETYPVPESVTTKEEAFQHYLHHSRIDAYSPNEDFAEAWYLRQYPDVAAAVQQHEFLNGFDHYLQCGEEEGRLPVAVGTGPGAPVEKELMRSAFDAKWYVSNYSEVAAWCEENDEEPFEHYLKLGARNYYSPNSHFDERAYVSAYRDVSQAIESGALLSGFHHFTKSGQFEGRNPNPDLQQRLELKYPGITNPVGIARLKDLEEKLREIPTVKVAGGPKRLNILLPTLDPDIFFGGYTSAINLIRRLRDKDIPVRILVCEDAHLDTKLAAQKIASKNNGKFIYGCDILNISDRITSVRIHDNDRFLAYSAWMAYLASGLASHTKEPRFLFLVQEYEAIFHAYDAIHAIVGDSYNLPHVPIFNTNALKTFFQQNQIGIFRDQQAAADARFLTFEHGLTEVQAPSLKELQEREQRRFLYYARPESHAGRNMFELGILALREAIKNGAFSDEWTFQGVGALSDGLSVDLGAGFTMPLTQKLDINDYAAALKGFDMGMSLMLAPHPSLLPYEMASAGLIVVTNTFDYRNDHFFGAISKNVHSAAPSIVALANQIAHSVAEVENFEARIEGSNVDWHCSWDQAFSDEFIENLLESVS